jgi:hypothetical protein
VKLASLCALLVCCLCVSTPASAQSGRRRRELEPVTLQLRVAHPGTRATVSVADHRLGSNGRVMLQCLDDCSQQLPVGRYKLALEYPDTEREPDAEMVFLATPTQFVTHPPDYGLRALGLTLLIVGPALLVSGFSALVPNVFEVLLCHSKTCGGPWTPWTTYGVIATPIGLALGLAGFFLFKRNRWPFERNELTATPQLHMQWSIAASTLSAGVAGSF